jgi:hypothetical protein
MRWKKIEAFAPFFKQIASKADDYELGLAYSARLSGEESFLLSYNPRRRTKRFRTKILDTLSAFGLPTEAVIEADEALEPEECSWVLGLEHGSNRDIRATVYIEEVADYLASSRLTKLLDSLNNRYSLQPVELPEIGKPYILALDIHQDGLRYLKLYSYVQPKESLATKPNIPHSLLDESAPRLVQRRSGCTGQKVYRCYPYLDSDTPDAWEHWQAIAYEYGLDSLPFENMPITSIGARYEGDLIQAFSIYGCVVRPKG